MDSPKGDYTRQRGLVFICQIMHIHASMYPYNTIYTHVEKNIHIYYIYTQIYINTYSRNHTSLHWAGPGPDPGPWAGLWAWVPACKDIWFSLHVNIDVYMNMYIYIYIYIYSMWPFGLYCHMWRDICSSISAYTSLAVFWIVWNLQMSIRTHSMRRTQF